MRKNLVKILALALFSVLLAATSCTKGNKSSGTGISSFSFKANNKAPDINMVTYIVDTIAGQIYNIDSISFSSKADSVVPVITFKNQPSEIRINDIKWNNQDAIDASKPFKLTIVSANTKNVKDYSVTVNRHTVNPDSIIWTKLEHNITDDFESAKVYNSENEFFLIGEALDKVHILSSQDGITWALEATDLDMNIDIMSGYAPQGENLKDSIYLLGINQNALYVYNSNENSFDKLADIEGSKAVEILGEYKNELLILAEKDGNAVVLSYHGGVITEKTSYLPASFPVNGGFSPVLVKYDESTTLNVESMFIVGGGSVHATDNGWYWSNVVKSPESNFFTNVTRSSAVYYIKYMYAFGGITESGSPKFMPLQVSTDNGFTWSAGVSYQKLPSTFTPQYGISAVVKDKNIYIFGGFDENGSYTPEFYKGRIRKVDFKQ